MSAPALPPSRRRFPLKRWWPIAILAVFVLTAICAPLLAPYDPNAQNLVGRLKPPGTLAFRRTRFEKAIHTLVQRNGLEKDRDAGMVVDAAE